MRWLLCASGCLLLAARASAQTAPPPSPGTAQEPGAPPAAAEARNGPTVSFRGFADINFAATSNDQSDDGKAADGFSVGNVVGHVSASLGGKFSFFGEVNLTTRNNAFVVDVARAFLRYDYNDRFKISAGRYHAPVGYWNTAFHRGLWLQTTIFRPDIIKEEWFQPDHFVGVFAEGMLSPKAGVGYIVGYGNGREADLGLACDEGCVSHHRAMVVRLFARPPQVSGVEFGGAVYHDTIAVSGTPGFPELITSAYVAITRETPEVLAEFSNVRHYDRTTGTDFNSQAFYVQVGYRLPEQPKWKPYGRFEKAIDPNLEPVIGPLSNWKATAGVRYELTDFAALKVEYGHRRNLAWAVQKPQGLPDVDGFFVQTAFTF